MTSVTSITKEKTAMIIPNAVGVSTGAGEKHMFTSFLYRDHAHGVMTQAWVYKYSIICRGVVSSRENRYFEQQQCQWLKLFPNYKDLSEVEL